MPSRRDQIAMTEDELRAFVAEQMIVSVATIGPRGRPHLVPLWYSPDGIVLRSWTYAKSQKAKNLERDPRATLQIEDGVLYQELRGVMLECDVALERDPAEVEKYGLALFGRYAELNPDVEEMVRAQAHKRVGLTFTPTRTVSWDHRKLGGTY
jgi:PPOX class probable F420-dependent enzyme